MQARALLVSIAVFGALHALPRTTSGSIAITEVMGNANGSDTAREWIELYNYGPDAVELGGWKFATDSGSQVDLPVTTLPSGGFIILADNKTTFQNEWLGGAADGRVFTAVPAFDVDNGLPTSLNTDDLRILSPLNNDIAWEVITPWSADGRATFLAEDGFTAFVHGNGTAYPVNLDGNDPGGTLGYESNDNTADPHQYTSSGTGPDVGSPLAGAYTPFAHTVVAVANTAVPYTQDFNTLGKSAGSFYAALSGANPLPPGWRNFAAVGGFNRSYRAESGALGTGNVLSLGADGAADRAFGTLRTSGNYGMSIGFVLRNDTAKAMMQIVIAYTGEQWRIGENGRADFLDFAYSLDAINLDDGTWIDADALDFSSPVIGDGDDAGTALDGNLAANRTVIGPVTILLPAPLAPGATCWVRWNDRQVAGSDDELGIDDLTVRLVPVSVGTVFVIR